MAELDRVRWRCRRGLLELDLILERFVERCWEVLSTQQKQAFMHLLDEPDNDLWDLIAGRSQPNSQQHDELVRMLRKL